MKWTKQGNVSGIARHTHARAHGHTDIYTLINMNKNSLQNSRQLKEVFPISSQQCLMLCK